LKAEITAVTKHAETIEYSHHTTVLSRLCNYHPYCRSHDMSLTNARTLQLLTDRTIMCNAAFNITMDEILTNA